MQENPFNNPSRVLSFTDHLQELRIRIIICLVFFVISLAGGFFIAPRVIEILILPLVSLPQEPKPVLELALNENGSVGWSLVDAMGQPQLDPVTTVSVAQVSPEHIRIKRPFGLPPIDIGKGRQSSLYFLSPLEPFFLWLQAALLVSAIFTIPMAIYQFWLFVSPGLLRQERRVITPLLFSSLLLFPLGAGFAYVMLRITLKVLLSFGDVISGLEPNIVATQYMGFAMGMMIIFGVIFEFPLVLVLLSRLGIVSSQMLVAKRKYAIVVITVLSAAVTPSPDPLTMILMLIPMLGLYEASIWSIRMMEPRGNSPAEGAPAKN